MRRFRTSAAFSDFFALMRANRKQILALFVPVVVIVVFAVIMTNVSEKDDFETSFMMTNDTISIGIRTQSGGFAEVDENGEIVGFDKDYSEALMQKILGDQEKLYEYVPITSQAAGASIKYGETDISMGLLVEGTNQVSGFALSDPYYTDLAVAVVQGGSQLDSLLNMSGGKLGVLSTSLSDSEVEAYVENNGLDFDVLSYSDYESVSTDIEHGRVNAVVMPLSIAKQFEASGYRILADSLFEIGYHILLPTGQEAVVEEVNLAIAELEEEGITDALEIKWGV